MVPEWAGVSALRIWKAGICVAAGTDCALRVGPWRLFVHRSVRLWVVSTFKRRSFRRCLRAAAVAISAAGLAGCAILPIAQDRPATTPAGSLVTVAMLDASHGWELTSVGIWRTFDGGRTWARITNLPPINYAWGTVASFPSPDVAWVCEQGRARGSTPGTIGDTRTSSSPPARCFATADGGRTWSTHNVPDSGTTTVGRGRDDSTIDGLTATDGRSAWVIVGTIATFAGGGEESINLTAVRLLHTLDGGARWASVRAVEALPKASVAATGAEWVSLDSTGRLYVSGFDNGIDRSSDLGRTWQRLAVPIPSVGEPGTAQYCSIAAHGSRLLVTIREYVANAPRAFYEQSADAGMSWSPARAPAVASTPGQTKPLC